VRPEQANAGEARAYTSNGERPDQLRALAVVHRV